MSTKLTDKDITEVAQKYGISPRSFKAVIDIESSGNGFLKSGKPVILFEGHIFSRLTKGKYDSTNPNISYPKWDKSKYKGGEGEWTRLEEARKLDDTAALKSASWGLGQVLGENHGSIGYSSVQAMVADFSKGERQQAEGMAKFIAKNPKLLSAANEQRWADFARIYNGPGYAQNRYDLKLKQAYDKATNFLSEHKVAAASGGIVLVIIIAVVIWYFVTKKKQ